jgi:hypothetical protein
VTERHQAASRGQPPPRPLRACCLLHCTRGELLMLPMPLI